VSVCVRHKNGTQLRHKRETTGTQVRATHGNICIFLSNLCHGEPTAFAVKRLFILQPNNSGN